MNLPGAASCKKARANVPGLNDACEKVLAALKDSPVPLSKDGIYLATRMRSPTLENAISHLLSRAHQIVSVTNGARAPRYMLAERAAAAEKKKRGSNPGSRRPGPYAIAAPITYPGYVYGGSRL